MLKFLKKQIFQNKNYYGQNSIYKINRVTMYDLLSAKEIRKRFRNACGKDVSLPAIHHVAQGIGYREKQIGGKRGYHKSVYTALTQHFKELVDYDKARVAKASQKPPKQPKQISWNDGNYFTYNGEKDNADYEWEKNENRIRRAIMESITELDLFHGSQADFQEFDLAFISSGWGQQAYGYGVYLIDNPEGAKEYARGGFVYTAKVPSGRYLTYKSISRAAATKIARDFFKYYTTENEYGREAYKGYENEFWNEECKYLCDCQTGGDIYGTIASLVGDDKETSEFLYREGYKGIKWVDVMADGTKNTNYVIFNPKDIKILKKEKVV